MKPFHRSLLFIALLLLSSRVLTQTQPQPPKSETVLSPGMRLTAHTPTGVIQITAGAGGMRAYTWEGATRSVEMWPRSQRWYGSLGIYYPGPGDHWKEHNGITRGVLEEGQQHFQTTGEALHWLRARTWMPYVYRDDGLIVGWNKTLPRHQLNVEVWQLYVKGKKPAKMPGSQNDKIVVTQEKAAKFPLVEAVQNNDLIKFSALLRQGADPNGQDSTGSPILVIAATNGKAALVQTLLDHGANPNKRSLDGSTALLHAVENDHLEVVKALVAKGANTEAGYERGMTKGVTPLMLAAMEGSEPIVACLLEKRASFTSTDNTGRTALHWAATSGKVPVAERLVNKGARVDSRDWYGSTPLMSAAMEGHLPMIQFLIGKGANIHARDDKTRQQYGRAGFVGDAAARRQIQQSGRLEVLHEDGRSVLDWARIGGHKEAIAALAEAGAEE